MSRMHFAPKWSALLALVAAAMLAPTDGVAEVNPQTTPNSLDVRGAGTMLPVLQPIAERYMREHPETTISLSGGSADRGLKSLIVGVSEMAMAIDDVPDELQALANSKKVKLIQTCIFRDGLAIVVAKDNPVSNLTMLQVKDIFRGAIKTWQDVGGSETPIEVVSHEGASGTYEVLKHEVLGDDAVVTPEAKVVIGKGYVDAIGEGSIGYMGTNDVGSLKVLTVDGVAPSADTVKKGTYPIVRDSCVYQRDPPTALGQKMVDFLFTDEARRLIAERNGVPIERGVK